MKLINYNNKFLPDIVFDNFIYSQLEKINSISKHYNLRIANVFHAGDAPLGSQSSSCYLSHSWISGFGCKGGAT